jgi:hypothetical protein
MGLGFMTLRSRTRLSLVNEFSSFLMKIGFGKPSLGQTMLVLVLCLKLIGSWVTRRIEKWRRRNFCFHMEISLFGMDWK